MNAVDPPIEPATARKKNSEGYQDGNRRLRHRALRGRLALRAQLRRLILGRLDLRLSMRRSRGISFLGCAGSRKPSATSARSRCTCSASISPSIACSGCAASIDVDAASRADARPRST